jgi:hypothetical protein
MASDRISALLVGCETRVSYARIALLPVWVKHSALVFRRRFRCRAGVSPAMALELKIGSTKILQR